jgi:uncharacterized glyoxalase superfamily protein PhnB
MAATRTPVTYPAVTPMIAYEDAAGALDWLNRAFGFRERMRYAEQDGTVTHAEMEVGDGLVMLATPTPDYQSPKHHRETCEDARRWSTVPYVIDGVHVYVDDVDAHFRRAKEAGATILSEPRDTEYGDRQYRAEDLEGHHWLFSQHVRDVAPEEWGATSS